jgi:hypothetical protein
MLLSRSTWIHWLSRQLRNSSRREHRPPRGEYFRPRLEALEDRCLPSTLVVTNPLDDANVQGTLRYDIAHAASGDTILITPALHGTPIVLTQGELYLNKDVTIEGLPNHSATISGNHNSRVFEVATGTQVTLKDLDITAGQSNFGAAIYNLGRLTISDSTLSDNSAVFGGGIFNLGSLTISDSTLSGNSAAYGGGIYNFGGLTVGDSTLSDNSAGEGGGIYNFGGLTVSDSTLSDNSAGMAGGGISNFGGLAVSNTDFCHNHPDDIEGGYTDEGGNTFC